MRQLTDGEREILNEQNRDAYEAVISGPCAECGEDGYGLEGEPESFICQFCGEREAGL